MSPPRCEATIRRALPTDARALATVHVASWRVAYRGLMPDAVLDGLDVDKRAERWHALLSDPQPPDAETWLSENGARVCGFVSLGSSRDAEAAPAEVEVYAIYLAPDVWGQGLGRALLAHAFELARARGAGEVILWVLDTNARARRFYEAAGMRADRGEKIEKVSGVELPHVRYRASWSAEAARTV